MGQNNDDDDDGEQKFYTVTYDETVITTREQVVRATSVKEAVDIVVNMRKSSPSFQTVVRHAHTNREVRQINECVEKPDMSEFRGPIC
jgi:UTP-glucose-1-phosphate uridylyltransferase